MIKTYTVYAEANDMTFIMQRIENAKMVVESVIGWYYGEPNDELTEEHAHGSLAAGFEK